MLYFKEINQSLIKLSARDDISCLGYAIGTSLNHVQRFICYYNAENEKRQKKS